MNHQAFEECLFVHLSIITIALYILKLQSFDHETKHLITFYYDVTGMYRVTCYICIILCKYLLYCYKYLTDLQATRN